MELIDSKEDSMEERDIKVLNERLAVKVGFHFEDYDSIKAWCGPNSTKGAATLGDLLLRLPGFTESMDSCIEWIVPKIPGLIQLNRFAGAWSCRIQTSSYTHYDGIGETIALAFCLAADRYLKETSKDG